MKKNWFNYSWLFVFLFTTVSLGAQEIKVKTIEELSNDLTARTNVINDKNNIPCAVVKVQIPSVEGMVFDEKQVIKQSYSPGEYVLYVPTGTKKIRYQHKDFYSGEINFADMGIKVESQITYRVLLIAKAANTGPDLTSQYVVFNVNPKNAVVMLADSPLITDEEGCAQKFVPFGTYSYVVESPDYHSAQGTVKVSNQTDKVVVNINLKPAFGWLEIQSESLSDCKVFVDNNIVGSNATGLIRLSSGKHHIRIIRPLYEPFEKDFVISDSQTTSLKTSFKTNYSDVTINVPAYAQIWLNDSLLGTGSWTGELERGDYKLETKSDSYRTDSRVISVGGKGTAETVTVKELEPIYGALNISSSVSGADVIVDGKVVGQTPLVLQNVLIGKRSVKVSKSNLSTFESEVNVVEGQTTDVKAELKKETYIKINTNPSICKVLIDNVPYDSKKLYFYGNHKVSLTAPGYFDCIKNIEITKVGETFDFVMDKAVNLTINSNVKKFRISVDGKEYPDITQLSNVIVLPAGSHTIEVDAVGYKKYKKTENINSNKVLNVVLVDSSAKKVGRGIVRFVVGTVVVVVGVAALLVSGSLEA